MKNQLRITLVILFLTTIFAVSCGTGASKEKMVGTWQGKEIKSEATDAMTDEQKAITNRMAVNTMFTFNEDGTVNQKAGANEQNGKWELAGETVTINFDNGNPALTYTVVKLSDNELELKKADNGKDMSLVLEKK